MAVPLRVLEAFAVEIAVAAGMRAIGIMQFLPARVVSVLLPAPRHAARLPQLQCDVARVRLVRAVEGDVVGYQEFARAGDQRAEPRIEAGRAEVGLPLGILQFLFQAFVLALAHHRQVAPRRVTGSVLVEVNRDVKFPADALAQAPREFGAIVHGHVFDRDKRAHVAGAHARVRAAVHAHVDEPRGDGDAAESSLDHALRVADEGHHGAVGVRAGVDVHQSHARHRLYSLGDLAYFGQVAAFRKIGYALD